VEPVGCSNLWVGKDGNFITFSLLYNICFKASIVRVERYTTAAGSTVLHNYWTRFEVAFIEMLSGLIIKIVHCTN
jgi:hypothetical protein